MGTKEPNWVISGHLIKYEPGFITRSTEKNLRSTGINYNQLAPATVAFNNIKIRTLSASKSRYVKDEQTKQESIKSYTGQGCTI